MQVPKSVVQAGAAPIITYVIGLFEVTAYVQSVMNRKLRMVQMPQNKQPQPPHYLSLFYFHTPTASHTLSVTRLQDYLFIHLSFTTTKMCTIAIFANIGSHFCQMLNTPSKILNFAPKWQNSTNLVTLHIQSLSLIYSHTTREREDITTSTNCAKRL